MSETQPDLFTSSEEKHVRHQNHYLFSDYYLEQLLPSDAIWRDERDAAVQFLTWLQQLYADEGANLANYNEAQLEANWIQPILNRMGWKGTYETQATIPALTAKRIRKPDYVFFPNSELRSAAVTGQNTDTYANDAVVVGEAKRWGVALNKKQGGKPTFENNNPSYQIDYYLRATDVRWGILTNGRYWRLVNKESSYKLDVYFEVDLQDVLDNRSVNGMLFFWLFFRQASFVPNEQGIVFVESALTASVNYAREVENDLRENAYKALEQLIDGFFAFGRNNLSAGNPDDLETVYTNSLYLLYRLLFLLYGESRGLLPLNNKKYNEVSLTNLVKDVKDKLDVDDYQFSPFSQQYWARQRDLCHIINGTNPDANAYYGVPRYNGGLFSNVKHPFLETHVMGDAYLLRAIDYLARRDRHKKGEKAVKERVDYRTLGVRQLGSIYEGLLEYRPAKAAEPMVTIRRKGNEVWIPATERGKKSELERRETGELYLATDKGERKATGSYYTPDYIVRYIVEQTLQPLLDGIETAVEQLPEDERGTAYAKRVLALNVLDPAMGSGHFLVAAAEYLALALTNYQFSAPNDMPNTSRMSELERQAWEKNYWLRRVTETCIYGVDKNEMAVELAKLSLWLTTVAADKPLSFLDHHLRHGDSLVGARLTDLRALPDGKHGKKSKQAQPDTQAILLDQTLLTDNINTAVQNMLKIEQALSDSVESIHQKEAMFDELRDSVARWHRLANVWVSSYFGNGMSPEEYADVARMLQGKATVLSEAQLRPFLDHPAVTDNDYFHWEFEFPEVFFDGDGRPLGDDAGFDAVIGNPPYGLVPSFNSFRDFSNDAFVHFWVQAFRVSAKDGYLSFISPSSWLTGVSFKNLRQVFLQQAKVNTIVILPYDIFVDAYIDTSILITQKRSVSISYDVNVIHMQKRDDANKILKSMDYLQISTEIWKNDPAKKFMLNPSIYIATWYHQSKTHVQMGEITRIERGVQLYSRKLHSQEQINFDFLRVSASVHLDKNLFIPELKGEELSRHCLLSSKKTYLEYSNRLASKRDRAIFETPRVVLRRLLTRRRQLQAAVVQEPLIYTDNILSVLVINKSYELGFIAGLLNSKFIAWLYTNTSNISVKDDFPQVTYSELNSLPIPTMCEGRESTVEYIKAQAKKLIENSEFDEIYKLAQSNQSHEFTLQCNGIISILSESLIKFNLSKQSLVRRFFLDLEGIQSEKDFQKLCKGKWEESIHKRMDVARPFVREDSRSTVMLDAALGWNEDAFKGFVKLLAGKVRGMSDLLDVYRTYHPEYLALTQKIAQTDALIDQLVYKLYGLTDEEIALVEAT